MEKKRRFARLRLVLALLGAILGLTIGVVEFQSPVLAATFALVGFCGIWIFARILYWICSRRMRTVEHNIKYMEQIANQTQKQQNDKGKVE